MSYDDILVQPVDLLMTSSSAPGAGWSKSKVTIASLAPSKQAAPAKSGASASTQAKRGKSLVAFEDSGDSEDEMLLKSRLRERPVSTGELINSYMFSYVPHHHVFLASC